MDFRWEPVGRVSPHELVAGRIVLHHATQLVAAVGRSLITARADDGHTSLEWAQATRGLAGQTVQGPRPWRAALRVADLTLTVQAEAPVSELSLAGVTPEAAFEWLRGVARELGAPAQSLRLDAPYTIPAYPGGPGAPFPRAGEASRSELAHWLANADDLLRGVAGSWPGAAPVRIWPHHFDVGSVLPRGTGGGEHDAPAIGIGLSPGDEGIPEPYLYVTPWPPPPAHSLPPLPAGGRWHTTGWTGALLTASEIVGAGGAAAQAALASRFLAGALEALR
jgi:hypothetical protein